MEQRGVFITGASTGIGRATALHLDQLGFRVFAGVRRDADGEALRQAASDRLQPVLVDVTDEAQVEAAAKTVRDELDGAPLAGIVNNAGIAVPGPMEFLPLDELRRQLEVNVVGQVTVTQAFLPLLRPVKGRVVMVSSIGGRTSTPFMGPYHASKHALEAISDSLRMELRPWGIPVVVIQPGSFATSIWERGEANANAILERVPPEAEQLYGADVDAMRRAVERLAKIAGRPETVAKAVAKALTAPRPRTRYVVGRDAKAQAVLVRVAPDRLMDAVTLAFTRTGRPR